MAGLSPIGGDWKTIRDALLAAVFDALYASSTRDDESDQTPRPFDSARDGLVAGEGASGKRGRW